MPNGTSSWFTNIGAGLAGTVIGGLIMRGFITVAVGARLKSLEEGQSDIKARLLGLEQLLLSVHGATDRRRRPRP